MRRANRGSVETRRQQTRFGRAVFLEHAVFLEGTAFFEGPEFFEGTRPMGVSPSASSTVPSNGSAA